MVEITVSGAPATYSTTREKEWKSKIATSLPRTNNTPNQCSLEFHLSALTRHGHPFDLDNLCVPVFSVLRQSGWFDGNYLNVSGWDAVRILSESDKLILTDTSICPLPYSKSKITFQQVYRGKLPASGSDDCLASWIQIQSHGQVTTEFVALELRYGSGRVNIGEIVSGSAKVKSVIDSLYPLLGGVPSRPMDWRIQHLRIEKGCIDLADDEVQITLFDSP